MSTTVPSPTSLRSLLGGGQGWAYLLLPFIPIAVALDVAGASAPFVFFASALGVIPTAALMGRATEELADRAGPGIEGQGLPSPGAERVHYGSTVEQLSFAVAVVLILSYVAGLVFSLRTHRDLFNPEVAEEEAEARAQPWSVRRSVVFLAIAGALVGLLSQ